MHFLKLGTSIFGAAVVAAVLASPVVAKEKPDKKPDKAVGAPGPVAGVGLIGVVVAGGVTYLLSRRRRKPDQD